MSALPRLIESAAARERLRVSLMHSLEIWILIEQKEPCMNPGRYDFLTAVFLSISWCHSVNVADLRRISRSHQNAFIVKSNL